MSVTLIAFSLDHRALAGLGAVGIVTYYLCQFAPSSIVKYGILITLAASIFGLIALYTGILGFDISVFNEIFVNYTGRNAVSGRQIIWPIIISYVSQSPWFGLGSGATFSQLYASEWSAHSYYIQVYMQTGIFGLSVLIALMVSIWKSIGKIRRRDPLSCYATSVFALLLIHMSLEVFLMQTNLMIGFGAWMAVGLCVGLLRIPDRKLKRRLRIKI
ncbi:O-antigen ligase family protein [Yangia mangrovi]|uniref:O-antigen ligase family protein n=1 Tax=Alloyangia mangrovi TaxID=1779329 RepID=A0ABT2KPW8_9RHOB|nr:O-antigen ligase family protein [Alloyangia mangrovi]